MRKNSPKAHVFPPRHRRHLEKMLCSSVHMVGNVPHWSTVMSPRHWVQARPRSLRVVMSFRDPDLQRLAQSRAEPPRYATVALTPWECCDTTAGASGASYTPRSVPYPCMLKSRSGSPSTSGSSIHTDPPICNRISSLSCTRIWHRIEPQTEGKAWVSKVTVSRRGPHIWSGPYLKTVLGSPARTR